MPIGPGGLDSNGIWQFGEDDSEALASDLLNLGMASVSTAIGGLGGPGILQVVSTIKTDTFTATPAAFTYVDITGFELTITPSSTSSKIMVIASMMVGSGARARGRLVRDSTPIGVHANGNTFGFESSAASEAWHPSISFLDSPVTTSSVTYKVQMTTGTAGQAVYVNQAAGGNYRGTSQLTLMEVAG